MAPVLNGALDALKEHGCITSKEEAATRLCLEEALVNAVRHGNRCDAERKVRLELLSNGEQCTIRVSDEGSGFSPEDIRMPECDQLGGRGICLMRHYMEKVCFNPRSKCLEMMFRRKLNTAAD
jgi:serine/threonine-protein kinase RsbW